MLVKASVSLTSNSNANDYHQPADHLLCRQTQAQQNITDTADSVRTLVLAPDSWCTEHNAHTNSDMGTLLFFIHQPVVDEEKIRPGQVRSRSRQRLIYQSYLLCAVQIALF